MYAHRRVKKKKKKKSIHVHEITQIDDQIYQCLELEQNFCENLGLMCERTHTGEKPYRLLCVRKPSSKAQILFHIRGSTVMRNLLNVANVRRASGTT